MPRTALTATASLPCSVCTAAPDPQPSARQPRFFRVPYLEPGRKRRRTGLSVTTMLWLVAVGLALAVAVQALLR
jgi:hypothetical protein